MASTNRPRNPLDASDGASVDVPRIGEEADSDVRSRTSLKRERVNNEKALAGLVTDLLDLNEEAWAALGVPEPAVATLVDARKIRSHGARARHLRLIRAHLRDADWMALRRRLDLRRMGIVAHQEEEQTTEWCEVLLIQGDAGLARLAEQYESIDRKRLRQLMRNVKSAPEGKRGKARLALERALSQIVTPEGDASSE